MYHGANERFVLESKGNIAENLEKFSLKVSYLNRAKWDAYACRNLHGQDRYCYDCASPAHFSMFCARNCALFSVVIFFTFFFTPMIQSFAFVLEFLGFFSISFVSFFNFICFD